MARKIARSSSSLSFRILQTARSAIEIAYKINQIREQDMAKLHQLGKVAAESGVQILRNLYGQPLLT